MKKIVLKHPVTIGDGTRLESITVRRPTVGDVIASGVKGGAQDMVGEVKLLARLCNGGMILDDLYLLDIADYMAVQAELARFLSDSEA